ncbi:MAG TPA: RHS repeat-associated core domain-containing protein [Pyrinomonadaceae bacterium]|nr:RHS repeat-associated core domain-containing protein [Pyrinomonadaceae bacterium]
MYDASGKLAAEYTINAPQPANPTISYLTNDALGSVRLTTDSFGDVKARRDFLPFGEELYSGLASRTASQRYSSGTDDTRKKFATYQRDAETGLDFAQSRYYSPMHGRFTSPDEFKGGPDELFDFTDDASDNPTFYADLTNPQSLNKYQYGYNNPYKFNDPDGHCPPCSPAQITAPLPWFIDLTMPKIGPTFVDPIVLPNGDVYRGKYYVDDAGNIVDKDFNVLRPAPRANVPKTREAGGTAQPKARPAARPMAKKGSTKNIQKANARRVKAAQEKIKQLKNELEKIPQRNKTPQIKEKIRRIENNIKREQERIKKSEEHSRIYKGN